MKTFTRLSLLALTLVTVAPDVTPLTATPAVAASSQDNDGPQVRRGPRRGRAPRRARARRRGPIRKALGRLLGR